MSADEVWVSLNVWRDDLVVLRHRASSFMARGKARDRIIGAVLENAPSTPVAVERISYDAIRANPDLLLGRWLVRDWRQPWFSPVQIVDVALQHGKVYVGDAAVGCRTILRDGWIEVER